ncbi:MAG: hypothetical protein KJ626_13060 [Verrucomicrobia bacterium]|nr:hypothetical protein [Verrucomicrobiota bacterium]
MSIFLDRKYFIARKWSNAELRKFGPLFSGDVVNVSGWTDDDKENGHYQNYFSKASGYTITNYNEDAKGLQGFENEIFLDIEKDLPTELEGRFDVVFNHTTLEHVFDFQTSFHNLCAMSRDIVIVIVPFLQQMHAHPGFGDYWRFTPLALKKMFEKEGLDPLYISFNGENNASVYIFAIGSKKPENWGSVRKEFSCEDDRKAKDGFESQAGCHAIRHGLFRIGKRLRKWGLPIGKQ